MNLVYIVMGLAMIQYLYFGFAVGSARSRYKIAAPAISGNEQFERYFRVHMNTLELLVVLIPALPLFAYYISTRGAAILGAVYLLGRFVYFVGYVKDPSKRGLGYGLSFLPVAILLLGGLGAAIVQQFRG